MQGYRPDRTHKNPAAFSCPLISIFSHILNRDYMNEKHACRFRELLDGYVPLGSSEWEALISLFEELQYSKGEDIISPAFDESKIFFICSGLVRYFYLSEDGKEWNKAFFAENSLSASFTSDFLGDRSPYAIQTMENTVVLIANYEQFESLFERYPSIERVGRKFIEDVLKSKMRRERSFLNGSAAERYRDFLNIYSGLSDRIPQYHIASYLGIGETSLSRLLTDSR